MRRSIGARTMAAGLAMAAAFLGVSRVEADGRPRYRSFGPVVRREPPAPYWRRYFGPVGTYGSPYYALANRRPYLPPVYGGYGNGGYGYGGYGYGTVGGYGFLPPAYAPFYGGPYAAISPQGPLYFDPYSNPALQETMLENELRWGMSLPPRVTPLRVRVQLHPSTPEQKVKSIHAQAQGDVWMKRLKFLNAYERYKYAISSANDRPEPYFRLGYALAAVGSYDSAVKYLKQGLELDPQWPSHGEHLEAIFGDDNRLAILSLIERVTGWVREDIRDPDRLFLVGVLLHFKGDDRASQFFEAAYRLSGSGDHLLAFLQPQPESKETAGGPTRPGTARGQYDGAPPPPLPAEPPLPLEAIPGAALSPPGTNPQNSPLPPRATGANSVSPTNPTPPPPPSRVFPKSPPASTVPPANTTPQKTVPPAPALPLPPLPAPAEPAPNPQSGPQSSTQPPTGGPRLLPPADGSKTAQSP